MSTPEELLAGPLAGRGTATDEDGETRAAIYARTSSTSQQFGYSINEQVRRCWERCELMDWPVTHVFRDEAKSGKNTDRPMFQELLASAEQGEFDVVVFWKLDRFSRSIMHAVLLEKEFRDWEVGLHSVTEQIDTTTAAGRFNFRNIANAAEFERDLIKQRTQMGHAALALDQKWPNETPPLGYSKRDDGRLEIETTEAKLVAEIFELYLRVRSMPEVARSLNEKGSTTRAGNRWSARTVGDILRNRLYIGDYTVGQVGEHVPEYEILNERKFEAVSAIRHRFQHSKSKRGAMSQDRKTNRVIRVVDDYTRFTSINI